MIEPVLVANRGMERAAAFDPNAYSVRIYPEAKGNVFFHFDRTLRCGDVVTVPFEYNEYDWLGLPAVKGQINGRSYPFIFDTGCNPYVIVEDRHVHENDMPVYFQDAANPNSSFGVAIADEFRVGSLVAEKLPCMLWKHHTEIRLLGLPVCRTRDVFIPLSHMKGFRYFEFDQIGERLRFSDRESFEPGDPSAWIGFDFVLEHGKLLLTIPVEGIEIVWFLDTGSSGTLDLNRQTAERIIEGRAETDKLRIRNGESFAPFAGGKSYEKCFAIQRLAFGEGILTKAGISFIPDRDAYEGEDYQGTIGFGLFKKTVMVLDFERKRMWVKKAEGSRFGQ